MAPGTKPVPLILTLVRPASEPSDGSIELTVRASDARIVGEAEPSGRAVAVVAAIHTSSAASMSPAAARQSMTPSDGDGTARRSQPASAHTRAASRCARFDDLV